MGGCIFVVVFVVVAARHDTTPYHCKMSVICNSISANVGIKISRRHKKNERAKVRKIYDFRSTIYD